MAESTIGAYGGGGGNVDRSLASLIRRYAAPGFVWRLDRWLRLHQPLVWRTRVHWFVWFSLTLGNPLLFALGWLYPVRQTFVPTIAEVSYLVMGLQTLGLLALGLWWRGQRGSPLPEVRSRGYLLTLGLYWVCISTVLLNPLSFALPVVYRIAAVTPDQEFAEEYAFHERYAFWCCHHDITPSLVSDHEDKIRGALQKYGLADQYKVDEFHCGGMWGRYCIVTDTGFGVPIGLAGVLNSVNAAKHFRHARGAYYDSYVASIGDILIRGVLFAGLLTIGVLSPTMLSRRIGPSRWREQLAHIRLPQPRFVAALDRRLRIRYPLIWSLRMHGFLFLTLVYGILVLMLLLVISVPTYGPDFGPPIRRLEDFAYDQLMVLALALPMPAWFAFRQTRAPLNTTTVRSNVTALLLYSSWTILPQVMVLVAIWVAGLHPPYSPLPIQVMLFAGIIAFYLAGSVLLGRYLVLPSLLVAMVLGAALVAATFTVSDSLHVTYPPAIGVWFALMLSVGTVGLRTPTPRGAALLAGIYLLYASIVAPLSFMFITDDLEVIGLFPILLRFAAVIPLYLIIAIPAIRVLIKCRYYPTYR